MVLEGSASLPGFQRMRDTYGEHDVDNTQIKNRSAIVLSSDNFDAVVQITTIDVLCHVILCGVAVWMQRLGIHRLDRATAV